MVYLSNEAKKINYTTITLVVLLFILSLMSGYFYYEIQKYRDLEIDYKTLYNRSATVEEYYDELIGMYSELREEYGDLLDRHAELVMEYSNLTKEYEDVLSYRKAISLVSDKTITLEIESNETYLYDIPFSGFIEVSFSADDDVYVWIGSSSLDQIFYSRYPQFPETVEAASFKVPVQPDLRVFIGNPNEFNEVTVTFSIDFFY